MPLTNHKYRLLAQAAVLLNRSVADLDQIPPGFISGHLTWTKLELALNDLAFENALAENLSGADELFENATNAFADFHNATADVEIRTPTDEEVETFKAKLRELHLLVQSDQRLEAASVFAAALADLIESNPV